MFADGLSHTPESENRLYGPISEGSVWIDLGHDQKGLERRTEGLLVYLSVLLTVARNCVPRRSPDFAVLGTRGICPLCLMVLSMVGQSFGMDHWLRA